MTMKTLQKKQELPSENQFRESANAILDQCYILREMGDYPSAQRLAATLFEVLVRDTYRRSVGKLQSGSSVADVVQYARTQHAISNQKMKKWQKALMVNHLRVGTASTFVADAMLAMCAEVIDKRKEVVVVLPRMFTDFGVEIARVMSSVILSANRPAGGTYVLTILEGNGSWQAGDSVAIHGIAA